MWVALICRAAVGALSLVVLAGSALAERRVALVVGNAAYSNAAPLNNPINDAELVGAALKEAGFEVMSVSDLDRRNFVGALRKFQDEADKADWALIYYAGHGMEVGGVNYLLPTDVKLDSDRNVEDETISLDRVRSAISGAKSFRMVVLDACRNNPFISTMKRSLGGRSSGRGLARVESRGTLIVYSAEAGTVASDGAGRNSPFASALAKYLREPGLEVRKTFDRVTRDVLEATGNNQQPFMYGSLIGDGDLIFRPTAVVAVGPNVDTSTPLTAPASSMIAEHYRAAERAGTLQALEAFIQQYDLSTDPANQYYLGLARGARQIALEFQDAARKNSVQAWTEFLDAHTLDIENVFVKRGRELRTALDATRRAEDQAIEADFSTAVSRGTVRAWDEFLDKYRSRSEHPTVRRATELAQVAGDYQSAVNRRSLTAWGDFLGRYAHLSDNPLVIQAREARKSLDTELMASDYRAALGRNSRAGWNEFIAKYGDRANESLVTTALENLARLPSELIRTDVARTDITPSAPLRPPVDASVGCATVAARDLVQLLAAQAEPCLTASSIFKDCATCPEMVVLPAGAFTMGTDGGGGNDERPSHRVSITRRIAIGRYEITRDQYLAFVRDTSADIGTTCLAATGTPNYPPRYGNVREPGYEQAGNHPAVCVSWHDARDFAAWLSAQTGKTYRLPTEAEWEYAAKAGGNTTFAFGDAARDLCTNANVADSTLRSRLGWDYTDCRDDYVFTAPVGRYTPNRFGLFDVGGNAWEWVEDCYVGHYSGAPTNGEARLDGDCQQRVFRGGSWANAAVFIRSAFRNRSLPENRAQVIGFRVVRELGR